jgi:hypothetical protein
MLQYEMYGLSIAFLTSEYMELCSIPIHAFMELCLNLE